MVTYLGTAHVTYLGTAHVTYLGIAQVTYLGIAKVTYLGTAHVTYLGTAHVTYLGTAHVTYLGTAQVTYLGTALGLASSFVRMKLGQLSFFHEFQLSSRLNMCCTMTMTDNCFIHCGPRKTCHTLSDFNSG